MTTESIVTAFSFVLRSSLPFAKVQLLGTTASFGFDLLSSIAICVDDPFRTVDLRTNEFECDRTVKNA